MRAGGGLARGAPGGARRCPLGWRVRGGAAGAGRTGHVAAVSRSWPDVIPTAIRRAEARPGQAPPPAPPRIQLDPRGARAGRGRGGAWAGRASEEGRETKAGRQLEVLTAECVCSLREHR